MAMWMPQFVGDDQNCHISTIREFESVAHIYCQNLVATEFVTAGGF